MSDSELSSIPHSESEGGSRRGSQSQSRSGRTAARPAAAVAIRRPSKRAREKDGGSTPSVDSRPVTPPRESRSQSRSGLRGAREDSELLAKSSAEKLEMVPIRRGNDDEKDVKDAEYFPDDNNVRTALGSRPREEERERVEALEHEGAGSRRRMAARTNLKDGYYVDSKTSYFWIKYEMPLWIGLDAVCGDCCKNKCRLPPNATSAKNVCDSCFGVIQGFLHAEEQVRTRVEGTPGPEQPPTIAETKDSLGF